MLMLLADASLGCCWKFESKDYKNEFRFSTSFVYKILMQLFYFMVHLVIICTITIMHSSSREPLIQDEMYS
jgi:hypothetical protein